MQAKGKILIARPCYQYYEYDNLVTMEHLIAVTRSEGWVTVNYWQRGSAIPRLRNMAAKVAMDGQFDKLLFVDSDMFVEKSSLLHLLRHEAAVVAGLYVAKQKPHLYMAGVMKDDHVETLHDFGPGELIPIDRAGTGFMLIDVKTFSSIEEPYFSWDAQGNDNKDGGEDYYFCRKVRQAGLQIYADTDCIVGHVGSWIYGPDDHNYFAEQHEGKREKLVTMPTLLGPNGEVLVH